MYYACIDIMYVLYISIHFLLSSSWYDDIPRRLPDTFWWAIKMNLCALKLPSFIFYLCFILCIWHKVFPLQFCVNWSGSTMNGCINVDSMRLRYVPQLYIDCVLSFYDDIAALLAPVWFLYDEYQSLPFFLKSLDLLDETAKIEMESDWDAYMVCPFQGINHDVRRKTPNISSFQYMWDLDHRFRGIKAWLRSRMSSLTFWR